MPLRVYFLRVIPSEAACFGAAESRDLLLDRSALIRDEQQVARLREFLRYANELTALGMTISLFELLGKPRAGLRADENRLHPTTDNRQLTTAFQPSAFSLSSTAPAMSGKPTVASSSTSAKRPPSSGGTNLPHETASL